MLCCQETPAARMKSFQTGSADVWVEVDRLACRCAKSWVEKQIHSKISYLRLNDKREVFFLDENGARLLFSCVRRFVNANGVLAPEMDIPYKVHRELEAAAVPLRAAYEARQRAKQQD